MRLWSAPGGVGASSSVEASVCPGSGEDWFSRGARLFCGPRGFCSGDMELGWAECGLGAEDAERFCLSRTCVVKSSDSRSARRRLMASIVLSISLFHARECTPDLPKRRQHIGRVFVVLASA